MNTESERVFDFALGNHGSIFLLTPLTDEGLAWADAHLPLISTMYGAEFVVEARYIFDIVRGILDDGLAVEGD